VSMSLLEGVESVLRFGQGDETPSEIGWEDYEKPLVWRFGV